MRTGRTSRAIALAGLLVAALALSVAGHANDIDDALEHARALLRASPIVDGHNDLPWVIREKASGDLRRFDLSERREFDTDIPRLREGGVGAQFWSVWVPSALSPFEAMRAQLEQIDLARRMIAEYPDDFGLALGTADILREQRAGRIASLLGIEGGHSIGNSLGTLRAYYELGVRYMTLTHFHTIDWADSATDEARHGGITAFGEAVITEMNRLGMLVDLAHVSDEAMSDVLRVTEAPVIFSHSAARALTGHERNVPDHILERLPENGGVVMVPFIPAFVSEATRLGEADLLSLLKHAKTDAEWEQITLQYRAEHGPPPRASLTDVADHIEYIARTAGIDHVGIGADFYGADDPYELVQGLEDVSRYPQLFAELIRRGWSNVELGKLARENLLRAFAEVERIAADARRSRPPSTVAFEEPEIQP